jgi:predicted lipoprotein with Yx(FWY)xxD motif
MTDNKATHPDGQRPSCAVRWLALGPAAALIWVSALATPASAMTTTTTTGRAPVVKLAMTSGPLGPVLVTAKGRTLYVDTRDRANHVTCTQTCARVWPPLLLARGAQRAIGGPGVKGLGTVRRPGHRLQVTLHKMPLYLYAGDVRPGLARGQGLGGSFFVATPNGPSRSMIPPPTTTPATPPSTTQAPSPTTTPPRTLAPVSGGASGGTSPAPPGPPPTTPPPTTPPATTPISTPPVSSPPSTRPPTTTPPAPAPVGGGVAY